MPMGKAPTTAGWALITMGIIGIFVPFVPGLLLICAGAGMLGKERQSEAKQRKRKRPR